MATIDRLSPEDFLQFLSSKNFSDDVVDKFMANGVDGETFLQMSDELLKEVAPRIVDRVKLKKLQNEASSEESIQNSNLPDQHVSSLPAASSVVSENNDQWHLSFVIPGVFSIRTEDTLKTGVLTKRVRTEIVQALSSSILVHTKNPTGAQYNYICQKLIDKFPVLKDDIGSTGYGSWRTKLRDRFKFLRRPSTSETPKSDGQTRKRQNDTVDASPARKHHRKSTSNDIVDVTDNDLTELQSECAKKKKFRRRWIQNSQALVPEILEKYPGLKIRKIFRDEFKAIIGLDGGVTIYSLMESWPTWKERIIAYSNMEKTHRLKLRQLLNLLDSATPEVVNEDIVALQLLSELLIPKSKAERLIHIAKNSDDMSEVAKSIGANFPFLIVCCTAEEISYHVIVEQEPMCELSTFNGAIINLIASYYIYDIAYPKALNSLLLMIQHHILVLKDSQHDPPPVLEIVTSLKRMDK